MTKARKILFSNFYELEGNKTKRLRDAQLRLMKEYGHPFYWAPFVLFGEKIIYSLLTEQTKK